MSIPQINIAITNSTNAILEKQKETLRLQNDINQQRVSFNQSVNTFKFKLDEWKYKFLLTAPVAGSVAFVDFIHENQVFENEQSFCFINPGQTSCYARIIIPQYNFGKVAEGQEVLLQFPSYPYQEFGSVKGRIDFISKLPTDSGGYPARVVLPQGLFTSFHINSPIKFSTLP